MHSDGNFLFRFDPTPNLPRDSFVFRRRQNNDADKVDSLFHYTLPLGRWQFEAWTHAGFFKRGLAGAAENPSPSVRQSGDNLRALLRAQGPLGHSPFSLSLSGATQLGSMLLEGGSFGEGLRQHDNSADFSVDLGWKKGPYLAYAQGNLRYERLKSSLSSKVGRAERYSLGGMLGGEAWLLPERWALNGLVRVDKAGHFANPSAKVGSLWLLPWGLGLSANAGRSFRIPSFFELYMEQGQVRPNPDLLAESAWAFDVGVAWEGKKARATVGYFWGRFENLVVWEYFPPFALKPFNLGRAQTHGAEVEVAFGPFPWLHLEGAYTWLHAQNLQRDLRYAGKPLPYRPKHQLFARAEIGPRLLSAFVELHFQSSQTRNTFANLSWPSRSLLNAGLKSLFLQNPKLQLGLSFRNLLNTHSQDMAGYPLPPRALFLSLSLEWERAAASSREVSNVAASPPPEEWGLALASASMFPERKVTCIGLGKHVSGEESDLHWPLQAGFRRGK
jgi:iron complex outermembrane receptor protein